MQFKRFPRLQLANLPTPMESLPRFVEAIGGGPQLFIKRDDETGLATGGNKARKLEFLLADALEQQADVVITTGGPNSNHARMTVAAARKLGLECLLVVSGDEPAEYAGNLFLNELMGADLRFCPSEKPISEFQAQIIQELQIQGQNPYVIPVGGSTPLGSVSYALAIKEIQDQAKTLGIHFDYLFVANGSGGTLAGLLLGTKLFQINIQVIGVSIAPKTIDEQGVAQLVTETAKLLEVDIKMIPEEIHLCWEYAGDGYGIPTRESAKMIQLLAQTEGIFLDPVYTSKAMAGLADWIKTGRLTKDQSVLFIHTGGIPTLLQYAGQLRKMLDDY